MATDTMNTQRKIPGYRHGSTQHGIGLIEILIAVLLMSLGFLAAARMQVEGMRFSQSAYYQSQAHFLANDMINRMRSNIEGVNNGNYTDQTTAADASDPQCVIKQCTAQGLAQQDIYDWSTNLHPLEGLSGFVAVLPSSSTVTAQGQIIDMDNGVFAVVMRWSEVVNGQDNQENLRIQFALQN